MVQPATALGRIGLILPTFVQDTVPSWAGDRGRAVSGGASGASDHGEPRQHRLGDLATTCRRAEEAGADALWACDHLFWHGPSLECMVALTVAATATDRAAVGSCVLQLPLRRAAAVAKQVASMQLLSGGRMILGVGVGSHRGEYEQAGIDYRSRGRLLDEAIVEVRRSWSTGVGAGQDELEDGGPGDYRQLPEPPPVPVWVGGSSEAALRRAAALADGWMPLFLSPSAYQQALERLAKEVDRAGRPKGAVTPSMVLFISVDDDTTIASARGTGWMSSLYGIPAKAFQRHLVSGTAADVAGTVAAYRDAGAEHVVVYVTADEPLEQFERLIAALPEAGVQVRGQ